LATRLNPESDPGRVVVVQVLGGEPAPVVVRAAQLENAATQIGL
jgi:hypothetical protein